MSTLEPATISALSALAGSAIGALASGATTWFTQHHQEHAQRHNQEASRRERLFGEFIDQASQTYLDAMVQDGWTPSQADSDICHFQQASPLCLAQYDRCCRGSAGAHRRDVPVASIR